MSKEKEILTIKIPFKLRREIMAICLFTERQKSIKLSPLLSNWVREEEKVEKLSKSSFLTEKELREFFILSINIDRELAIKINRLSRRHHVSQYQFCSRLIPLLREWCENPTKPIPKNTNTKKNKQFEKIEIPEIKKYERKFFNF